MPDDDKLTPADPHDLAEAIAFALRYRGKKRVHQATNTWRGSQPNGSSSTWSKRASSSCGSRCSAVTLLSGADLKDDRDRAVCP